MTNHGENKVLRATVYLLPEQYAALQEIAGREELTLAINRLVGEGIARWKRSRASAGGS